VLSNALIQRLEAQMISATRDAIAAEPQLVNSALFETLAKAVCAQIVPDRPFSMPDAIRTKLPTIRQALNPGVFNTAIAKRFDAEDYFSNGAEGFCVKAIAEAINQDEARKVSAKPKADIAKFAIANLAQDRLAAEGTALGALQGPRQRGLQAAGARAAADPRRKSPPAPPTRSRRPRRSARPRRTSVQMKRAAAAKKPPAKRASADGSGNRGTHHMGGEAHDGVVAFRPSRSAVRRSCSAASRSARSCRPMAAGTRPASASPCPRPRRVARWRPCGRYRRCPAAGADQNQRLAQRRGSAAERCSMKAPGKPRSIRMQRAAQLEAERIEISQDGCVKDGCLKEPLPEKVACATTSPASSG
jgi:hypothetical protein